MKTSILLLSLAAAAAHAQLGPFTIGTYTPVQETRIDRTTFEYEFRVTATNTGAANAINVSAVASSNNPNVTIVPNANTLQFPNINAGQSASSSNTFKFRYVRTVNFAPSMISWNFTATVASPTANAGQNQTVNLGDLVTLNAGGSTDPNGLSLTRQWTLTPPSGCLGINLSSTTAVNPTFPANCVGNFIANLIVTNSLGVSSPLASVTISTNPVAPTANAGPNQLLSLTQVNQTVSLNGSASTSPGNLPLTYTWSFEQRPQGSTATLNNVNAVQPTFVADRIGLYRMRLIVNNGYLNSAPATVDITTSNLKPTANPGNAQSGNVNTLINLNGNQSSDPNSLPLTYTWSLTTRPPNSNAALNNAAIVNPTFTIDLIGTYIAQLIVCNPFQCSDPATVTVSTQLLPPTARPGNPQTVNVGATVNLSGLASTDPQNLPLTYSWSFNARPTGSAATLSSTTSATPSFTVDRFGDYVLQLTVSNGTLSSPAATVTISTNYVPPTANAGSAQNATVNSTVTLNGLASQSFSGYALTYAWSFNTRPTNSNATLTNPTSAQPTFVPDLPGIYIVQLIVNDTIQNSTPATVQISAAFGNGITLSGPSSLLSFDQANGTVTLTNPAGNGGQTVNLAATGAGTVTIPPTVVVPQGNTAANFQITGGVTAGPVNIQGTFPGFTPGSLSTTINNRPMTLAISEPTIAIGQSFAGSLTLTQPAPASGAVINIASLDPSLATVSVTSVTIPAGQTTATFNYTGVALGQTTLRASAAGYVTSDTQVTVTNNRILLPTNFALGYLQTTQYPFSLSTTAPPAGLNVTFTTQSGIALSSNIVAIPGGQSNTSTPPSITGNSLGVFTITARAPGFAPTTETVNVTITLTLTPNALTVNAGESQTVRVDLATAAPAGGLSIHLLSSNTALATVAGPLVIPAGQNTGTFTVNGIAAGTPSITVGATTGTNIVNLNVTVLVPAPVTFNGDTLLGRNAQVPLTVSLSQPAPPSGFVATFSTTSPNLLLSTSPTSAGSTSLTFNVAPVASSVPAIYVQNVNASSGTGTVRFSAPGYVSSDYVLTFTPSGFTTSPATINTTASAPASALTIQFNRLTAANAIDAIATLRPGLSESITLVSSAPAAATVTSPVSFTGNQSNATFPSAITPTAAGGQTNITITQPSGYATPAPSTPTVVNVANLNMTLISLFTGGGQIGRNQQSEHFVRLNGPTTVATTITVTAPTGTLLTTNPSVQGAASITLNLNAGVTDSPQFLIQNVDQISGGATLQLSSTNPLIAPGTGSVTFTRSGFYLLTDGGGTSLSLNLNAAPANLRVYFATVLANNSLGNGMSMRGGYSETIPLVSLTSGIVNVPASITYNTYGATSQLLAGAVTPVAVGSTNLSLTQPSANYFANTTYPNLPVTINNDRVILGLPTSSALGYDQVECVTVGLSSPAPAGGLQIQLSSPGPISFAADGSTVGVNPFSTTIPAGQSTRAVCYSNLATSTGSAAINATVLTPGSTFQSATANIAFWPSGFYPWTPTITLNTLNAAGADLQVWFAKVDPVSNIYRGDFPLRRGAGPKTIQLNSSNTTKVVVPASVVWPDDGLGSTNRNYVGVLDNATPASTGTSNITITQPAGHSSNTTYNTSVVTVSAPAVANLSCATILGYNLQVQCSASYTAFQLPLTATVTSDNPNLLISKFQTQAGSNFQTFDATNVGSISLGFYIQALAESGTATVTISVPGYLPASTTIQLRPSGFYTYSGSQVTLGTNVAALMQVYSAVLIPSSENLNDPSTVFPRYTEQELRGGLSQTVTFQSTNSAIHSTPLTVTFATTPGLTTGSAVNSSFTTTTTTGTAIINPIQPSGYRQTNTYNYSLRVQ